MFKPVFVSDEVTEARVKKRDSLFPDVRGTFDFYPTETGGVYESVCRYDVVALSANEQSNGSEDFERLPLCLFEFGEDVLDFAGPAFDLNNPFFIVGRLQIQEFPIELVLFLLTFDVPT